MWAPFVEIWEAAKRLSQEAERSKKLEEIALDTFYDLDPHNAVSYVSRLEELGVSVK